MHTKLSIKRPYCFYLVKKNFFLCMTEKMAGNNMQQTTNNFLKFSDTENKKADFYKSKGNIGSFDTDIKKIVVFDVFTYSKNKKTDAKYYTGYENDIKIKTLFIGIPQIIGPHNACKETYCMNFTTNDSLIISILIINN